MSGVKRSSYALEQRRQRILALTSALNTVANQRENLRTKVKEVINSSSQGIKASFAEDFKRAQAWLDQTEATWEIPSGRAQAETFEARVQERKALVDQGAKVLQALENALTVKAGALAVKASKSLSEIRVQFYRQKDVLTNWQSAEQVLAWEARLSQLKERIQTQDFKTLDRDLQTCQQQLSDEINKANQMEEQHQKRLYLLKALRQVCQDMGFEESQGPAFEAPGQRSSRIKLVVDTLDRGIIEFYLSLDNIQTHSQLNSQNCFEEFDQLSSQLKETFGVLTHFDPADGVPRPVLKRRGEKDEPNGKSMERHA